MSAMFDGATAYNAAKAAAEAKAKAAAEAKAKAEAEAAAKAAAEAAKPEPFADSAALKSAVEQLPRCGALRPRLLQAQVRGRRRR